MEEQNKPDYIKLPGSKKNQPKGTDTKNLDPEQNMEVTVRVRRKTSIESHLGTDNQYSREEYASIFGASDEDIDKIELFAQAGTAVTRDGRSMASAERSSSTET